MSPMIATRKRIAAAAATPPSTEVLVRYITAFATIVRINREIESSCRNRISVKNVIPELLIGYQV